MVKKVIDAFIAENKSDRGLLRGMLDAVRDVAGRLTGRQKAGAIVAEAKLTDAIGDVNLENENNIDTVGDMPYTEDRYALKKDKKYWVPDLSRPQMERLRQWVKYDAKTSENSITDTANWGFCKIGSNPVFTIYSTENQSEPTILYEVKGAQAEYERYILENILEEISYGESVNERSNSIDEILSGRWMQQVSGNNNDNGLVGRGSGDRDAAILPKKSRRKPRAAFKNVLGNLFQMEQRGVESDTTSYETEKQGPTLTDDQWH